MSADHFHFGPNPGKHFCAFCDREIDEKDEYYYFFYRFSRVKDKITNISTDSYYCSKKCAQTAIFGEGAHITNFLDDYP